MRSGLVMPLLMARDKVRATCSALHLTVQGQTSQLLADRCLAVTALALSSTLAAHRSCRTHVLLLYCSLRAARRDKNAYVQFKKGQRVCGQLDTFGPISQAGTYAEKACTMLTTS